MKKYIAPEFNVVAFSPASIIATSLTVSHNGSITDGSQIRSRNHIFDYDGEDDEL